jgi:hypothetical protein
MLRSLRAEAVTDFRAHVDGDGGGAVLDGISSSALGCRVHALPKYQLTYIHSRHTLQVERAESTSDANSHQEKFLSSSNSQQC